MSWVCAQVSISRAVSADAALMAGPNHGSLARGSSPAKVVRSSARAASNQSSIWAPLRSRNWAAISSGSIPPEACASASAAWNSPGRTAEQTAASSK